MHVVHWRFKHVHEQGPLTPEVQQLPCTILQAWSLQSRLPL